MNNIAEENDVMAMRMVRRPGGTVGTVGERPLIASSRVVKDQLALAGEVCNLKSLG